MGKFVRENPDGWKKEHAQFINAQIEKSWQFYEKLEKMPGGKEKIRKLRERGSEGIKDRVSRV